MFKIHWIKLQTIHWIRYSAAIKIMSNKLKKRLGVCYKWSDRDLFKGLRVCRLETQLGKSPGVFKEERKVKSSYNKKHALEAAQSYISHCDLGPGQSPVRCQAVRMMVPGGPEGGCQEAWTMGVGWVHRGYLECHLEVYCTSRCTPRHWYKTGKFETI